MEFLTDCPNRLRELLEGAWAKAKAETGLQPGLMQITKSEDGKVHASINEVCMLFLEKYWSPEEKAELNAVWPERIKLIKFTPKDANQVMAVSRSSTLIQAANFDVMPKKNYITTDMVKGIIQEIQEQTAIKYKENQDQLKQELNETLRQGADYNAKVMGELIKSIPSLLRAGQ